MPKETKDAHRQQLSKMDPSEEDRASAYQNTVIAK